MPAGPQINIILNWFEELKERVIDPGTGLLRGNYPTVPTQSPWLCSGQIGDVPF